MKLSSDCSKLQPTHGYQLLEYFRSPSALGRIWTMSASQLYAVLKRLSNEGDIAGKELKVRNAPSRVAYTVTASGEHKLEAWLFDAQPLNQHPPDSSFIFKPGVYRQPVGHAP
jgi:DNA-binding PadR family transcriptional regulator